MTHQQARKNYNDAYQAWCDACAAFVWSENLTEKIILKMKDAKAKKDEAAIIYKTNFPQCF